MRKKFIPFLLIIHHSFEVVEIYGEIVGIYRYPDIMEIFEETSIYHSQEWTRKLC